MSHVAYSAPVAVPAAGAAGAPLVVCGQLRIRMRGLRDDSQLRMTIAASPDRHSRTRRTRRSASPVELQTGQLVALLDGGRGRIVGFYRSATPTVLVRLDSGECRQVEDSLLLALQ
jgi:hypothetical protein